MTLSDTMPAGAARRHELPGLYNLRDTGGYRAADRRSRWGKLFRSDALHGIDASGQARLAELGITRIVDLRGSNEREAAASQVDQVSAEIHHLPVFDDADPATQARALVGLTEVYDLIVDERGTQLVEAIRVIASTGDGEATLVHCTAGKDRTGLVVGFALRAAGVDRDEVIADYAVTEGYLRGEWSEAMLAGITSRGVEVTDEIHQLITASPATVMDALLDRIDAEYGSIADYLRQHGLTDDELERLAAALID